MAQDQQGEQVTNPRQLQGQDKTGSDEQLRLVSISSTYVVAASKLKHESPVFPLSDIRLHTLPLIFGIKPVGAVDQD